MSPVVYTLFSKPSLPYRKINGNVLKSALAQIKPCIHLRQVRRGRKIFQIPRIIPSSKRLLFGARGLLSVLNATSGQPTRMFVVRDFDKAPRNKKIVTNQNHGGVSSHQTISQNNRSLQHGKESQSLSQNNEHLPFFQQNVSSRGELKRVNTRTSVLRDSKEIPLKTISYVLANEIRASHRAQSRSAEDKKRVYKAASANRGSIRMAWWL